MSSFLVCVGRLTVTPISADSDISALDQVLAKGSHDYLIKPLHKTSVLNRVAQTLEMHRSAARNGVYRKLMQANLDES